MLRSYIVEENFHDGAEDMRRCFERHFADPHHSKGPSFQIWDYWYVPGMYTYLRTDPLRIIPRELMEKFMARLRSWAMETLCLLYTSPSPRD